MKSENKGIKILSHFSRPEWPTVNKIGAIARCSGLEYRHSASTEKLLDSFAECFEWERILFFTDEGHGDLIRSIESKNKDMNIATVVFLQSDIGEKAEELSELKTVRFIIGCQHYDLLGKDLSILIRKFCDQDYLDLAKYLAFGALIRTSTVTSKNSKREAVEEVCNYVVNLGTDEYDHPYHEYARRVTEILDELLINAIFSANPRFKNTDRSQNFTLSDAEKVDIQWGFDGEHFGLAVRDPFGNFTKETILQYLDSTKKLKDITKLESGGLGIKVVFERTHQFIANIQSGRVTEVICLMRLESRLSDFEKKKSSFFYFQKDKN